MKLPPELRAKVLAHHPQVYYCISIEVYYLYAARAAREGPRAPPSGVILYIYRGVLFISIVVYYVTYAQLRVKVLAHHPQVYYCISIEVYYLYL